MRKGARPRAHDPAFVARVLADAAELGDSDAAKKHRISLRTLYRYRKQGDNPAVSERVTAAKEAVHATWLETAIAARRRLLDIVLERAQRDETSAREIVGALKIVNDAILAEQVLAGESEHGRRALDRDGLASPARQGAPLRTFVERRAGPLQ